MALTKTQDENVHWLKVADLWSSQATFTIVRITKNTDKWYLKLQDICLYDDVDLGIDASQTQLISLDRGARDADFEEASKQLPMRNVYIKKVLMKNDRSFYDLCVATEEKSHATTEDTPWEPDPFDWN
jgi:hypothetical protein